MRKASLIIAAFVLLAALAACGQGEESPPAIEEQEIESAAEAQQPSPEQPPEPPQEEPTIQLPPRPQLPAHLQYIVDAGQRSGSYRGGYATYTNTALNIIYHFDEENDNSIFLGISASTDPMDPGVLMSATGFKDWFWFRVIAGSGEDWVQQRANDFVEWYIEDWLEENEHIREFEGDGYEAWVAQLIESRLQNEQWREEWWTASFPGEPFEESIHPFTPDELEMVRFWPVEYEIAGRQFSGLQINVVWPGSGFNAGLTWLFHQIDDDTALVISIESEEPAGYVARRHVSRFSALP